MVSPKYILKAPFAPCARFIFHLTCSQARLNDKRQSQPWSHTPPLQARDCRVRHQVATDPSLATTLQQRSDPHPEGTRVLFHGARRDEKPSSIAPSGNVLLQGSIC